MMFLLVTVALSVVLPELAWAKCECDDGWLNYKSSCYLYVDDPLSWPAAQTVCRLFDATLAEIESAQENNFLAAEARKNKANESVWLGFNDIAQEGQYVWVSSQKPLTYAPWTPNEPNNGEGRQQDCGQMHIHGKWDDNDCEERK